MSSFPYAKYENMIEIPDSTLSMGRSPASWSSAAWLLRVCYSILLAVPVEFCNNMNPEAFDNLLLLAETLIHSLPDTGKTVRVIMPGYYWDAAINRPLDIHDNFFIRMPSIDENH